MSSKKNVLHLINGDRLGGAERVQEILLKGHYSGNVSIRCLGLKNGKFTEKLQRGDFPNYLPGRGSGLEIFQVLSLINELNIDIVHTHTVRTNLVGAITSSISDTQIVIHAHSWLREELSSRFRSRLNHHLNVFSYRRADIVVAVSDYIKRKLLKVGLDEKKIRVIKNGIDLESLPDNVSTGREYLLSQLPDSTDVHPDTKVIATTALFRPQKGTEDLLKAIAHLKDKLSSRDKYFRVYLLLIGDFIGPAFEERILNRINKLGLESSVVHLGFRDDVLKLMAGIDLFALPAFTEGLPYSLLEAMGLDLPVVANDVGGVNELIDDRKNGLLVPPGRPELMGDKLLHLIDNPETASELGNRAKERVRQDFNAKGLLNQVEQLYEDMAF